MVKGESTMNELNNDLIIRLFEYTERRAFFKGVLFATTCIVAGDIIRKLIDQTKTEEE